MAGPLRVLRLEQLLAAGLTPEAIAHRVGQGRLQRIWRGVYVIGPGPPGALCLAYGAVSSFQGASYLSHGWAAFVHGFSGAPRLPVDVMVTSGSRCGRDRIRVHRSATLLPRDLGRRQGIPVTSAGRGILDIAETASVPRLERLIADAQVAGAVTDAELRDVLSRAGRRRATTTLRAAIAASPGLTLSEAERLLRRLLVSAGVARPLTNHPIGRYRADFAWPGCKLIVELDGFAAHGHRRAFEHDRQRGAELTARGWSVMHVTWRQLVDQPVATVVRIAEALVRRETA